MSSTATRQTDFSEPTEYGDYLRAEWDLFTRDQARQTASREAVAGLRIRRVLDLGCGAGQQLRPFVADSTTLGIGVDVAMEAACIGRTLFAAAHPQSRIRFVRAAAENLPFADSSFDLIVCRLALPYTDNARALAEMARVLASGGAILLTFHHLGYYLDGLRAALRSRRPRSAIHACRVLTAGLVYHVIGRQPRGALTGGETFQTRWLLARELRRHRLLIRRVLADSSPLAPTVLIARRDQEFR